MAGQQSMVRKIINRNIERHLVKEYLMAETKKSGFGGLNIQRTPQGTMVTLKAERPGMVIGRRGKLINELTKQLDSRFNLENPKLEVDDVEEPRLNAQIMADKLAGALERGWYFRRAGHSTVMSIMEAGAKGVIVILNGKITGARHRTQKFIAGHVKYCGEPALTLMEKGHGVAVKKLGTIGCTVAIMMPGTRLPHEVEILEKGSVESDEEEVVILEEETVEESATVDEVTEEVVEDSKDVKGDVE